MRLTEPQAKAAFYASAANPASGLLPDELPVCLARVACDKYRFVDVMSPGDKVKVRGALRAATAEACPVPRECRCWPPAHLCVRMCCLRVTGLFD